MIYHLLPELEPFSATKGGALARDVANIMRLNPSHVVACSQADDTWGFDVDRILVLRGLRAYNQIRGKRFLPRWTTGLLLQQAFQPLLTGLKSGDVVWCHNQLVFSAALYSSVHAKGAKLIHHFHDGHAHYAARSAMRSFLPDASIFVSEFTRQQWLSLFPWLQNTHAIPNGADEALFHPRPKAEVRTTVVTEVLYVGRLQPEKGVHVLIDAMRVLQERNVDVVCRVVGSAIFGGNKPTPYVNSLLKASPTNVRFEGRRSAQRIAEEYRAADILCCPSIWQEPFGNVNIEAMASAIPVVATRVGGIPEIAADGGVLLVEPGSVVGLADALQKLIEDKELRITVAEKGLRSFQRRYTWTAVCREYQEVTDSL